MNGGISTTKTRVMKCYLEKQEAVENHDHSHTNMKMYSLERAQFCVAVLIFLWLHAIHQYRAAGMISKFPLSHQSRAADPLTWSNREFQTCFENVILIDIEQWIKMEKQKNKTRVLFLFTVIIFNLLIHFKINKKTKWKSHFLHSILKHFHLFPFILVYSSNLF